MMNTGIIPFMTNLIDYAGLFPPASLPLETAIRQHAAYQVGEDAWMLGSFVIPATKLTELDPHLPLFSKERPLVISAIGRKSTCADECLEALRADLKEIAAFRERHAGLVKVGVLELPLPSALPTAELLAAIADGAVQHNLRAFCEVTIPLGNDWERLMLGTLEMLSAHNLSNKAVLGLKLRTGGVLPEAFPTPGQVATVLASCRDRGIPMKFTAGLHHPVRMFRGEVGTKMHGFLNVFFAGLLAHAHFLNLGTITEILSDEEARSFAFTSEGLAWREYSLSLERIQQFRESMLFSYGSCSFDEPREDLQALGLL